MKKLLVSIILASALIMVSCQDRDIKDDGEISKNIIVPHHLDLIQSLQLIDQPGMQWMERERNIFNGEKDIKKSEPEETYWEMRVYDNPEVDTPIGSKAYFKKKPDISYSKEHDKDWKADEENRDLIYKRYFKLFEYLEKDLNIQDEKESQDPTDEKKDSDTLTLRGEFDAKKVKSIEGMGDFFSYLTREDKISIKVTLEKSEDGFRFKNFAILGKVEDKNLSLKEAVFLEAKEKALGEILPPGLVKTLIKDKKMINLEGK